ncbi:hypothetical protein BDW71DRAFT_211176 [Aspergillus fruticulosus]
MSISAWFGNAGRSAIIVGGSAANYGSNAIFVSHGIWKTFYHYTGDPFCPEPNKQYTDVRLSAYKDSTYESRASHLDNFKAGSMTRTLIHQLSHSYAILGPSQKVDVPFEGGPNGAAYGWGPVTSLAEQSSENDEAADYPLINADSFAFYVVAMYMENNDWHSGWALDYTDME